MQGKDVLASVFATRPSLSSYAHKLWIVTYALRSQRRKVSPVGRLQHQISLICHAAKSVCKLYPAWLVSKLANIQMQIIHPHHGFLCRGGGHQVPQGVYIHQSDKGRLTGMYSHRQTQSIERYGCWYVEITLQQLKLACSICFECVKWVLLLLCRHGGGTSCCIESLLSPR